MMVIFRHEHPLALLRTVPAVSPGKDRQKKGCACIPLRSGLPLTQLVAERLLSIGIVVVDDYFGSAQNDVQIEHD